MPLWVSSGGWGEWEPGATRHTSELMTPVDVATLQHWCVAECHATAQGNHIQMKFQFVGSSAGTAEQFCLGLIWSAAHAETASYRFVLDASPTHTYIIHRHSKDMHLVVMGLVLTGRQRKHSVPFVGSMHKTHSRRVERKQHSSFLLFEIPVGAQI